MKKFLFFTALTILFTTQNSFSQVETQTESKKGLFEQTMPSVYLKNLDGEQVNTATLNNNGKPMIVSFWATWCVPCRKELEAINDSYIDWHDETGVKVIAVSVDDGRTVARVKPFVDSQSWPFDVLLDQNGDFKRAMGVNNVPFTMVIDGNGVVKYTHNNYAPGDEFELYDELVKLAKGDNGSSKKK